MANLKTKSVAYVDPSNGALNIKIENSEESVNVDIKLTDLTQSNIRIVELLTKPNIKNTTKGIEGELMIDNGNVDTLVFVDDNGDFYISDEDAENYELNDMGELIYNQTAK